MKKAIFFSLLLAILGIYVAFNMFTKVEPIEYIQPIEQLDEYDKAANDWKETIKAIQETRKEKLEVDTRLHGLLTKEIEIIARMDCLSRSIKNQCEKKHDSLSSR